MRAGLNTIDCLLTLFRGRGHDVICINGSSDITNDYVEKLFKRSTSPVYDLVRVASNGVQKILNLVARVVAWHAPSDDQLCSPA